MNEAIEIILLKDVIVLFAHAVVRWWHCNQRITKMVLISSFSKNFVEITMTAQ